MAAHIRLICIV